MLLPVLWGVIFQVMLFPDNYRPLFSGHDTFPLRYGWLKKAYDQVTNKDMGLDGRAVFLSKDAIARFGVGKNMVNSIRHWSNATRIIEEDRVNHSIYPSELGEKLFGRNGCDPYMEHPATIWLIHWNLASYQQKTTWYWAFNLCPNIDFDREFMVASISRVAKQHSWLRAGLTTIKNDVACFVRSYVSQQSLARGGGDDVLESPLIELELIKAVGGRDRYCFVRGDKPTLGNGVFIFALLDYWYRNSKNTATLSLEAIAHAPSSPGRVFLMNESDVIDRLMEIDNETNGKFRWSQTAGLNQVVRGAKVNWHERLKYVDSDYL